MRVRVRVPVEVRVRARVGSGKRVPICPPPSVLGPPSCPVPSALCHWMDDVRMVLAQRELRPPGDASRSRLGGEGERVAGSGSAGASPSRGRSCLPPPPHFHSVRRGSTTCPSTSIKALRSDV
jgi:hypothetical protein